MLLRLRWFKMFIEIDEAFKCEVCGADVRPLGYTCRDHCPKCLCSKHVDKDPGDRAEMCHGILRPVGLENNSKKGYIIVYKCDKCGSIRKNKMAEDDDFDLAMEIVKKSSFKTF